MINLSEIHTLYKKEQKNKMRIISLMPYLYYIHCDMYATCVETCFCQKNIYVQRLRYFITMAKPNNVIVIQSSIPVCLCPYVRSETRRRAQMTDLGRRNTAQGLQTPNNKQSTPIRPDKLNIPN